MFYNYCLQRVVDQSSLSISRPIQVKVMVVQGDAKGEGDFQI